MQTDDKQAVTGRGRHALVRAVPWLPLVVIIAASVRACLLTYRYDIDAVYFSRPPSEVSFFMWWQYGIAVFAFLAACVTLALIWAVLLRKLWSRASSRALKLSLSLCLLAQLVVFCVILFRDLSWLIPIAS